MHTVLHPLDIMACTHSQAPDRWTNISFHKAWQHWQGDSYDEITREKLTCQNCCNNIIVVTRGTLTSRGVFVSATS